MIFLLLVFLNSLRAHPNGKYLNVMNAEESITFHLQLSPRGQESELSQLVYDINTPGTNNYQNYLSHDEFCTKFCPLDSHVNEIRSLLINNSFTPGEVTKDNLLIGVTGLVSHVNLFFQTSLGKYENFFAPLNTPKLPNGVSFVLGLDTSIKFTRHSKIRKLTTISSPLGPSDIRNVYNIPKNATGLGQIGGIIEYDFYSASDPLLYCKTYNINPCPTLINVNVNGASNTPGSGSDEVNLDIDMFYAMSPNMTSLYVYYSQNDGSNTMISRVASDNIVSSIGCSWGYTETSHSSSQQLSSQIFYQKMAIQGQSYFAASGDNGAYSSGILSVGDPSSQPEGVIGVGGTKLVITSGNVVDETTWNEGGGGVSIFWNIPSYQKNINTSPSALGSTSKRMIPDVSLNADPATGYLITMGGSFYQVGGTSAAAPIWASFYLLVNEARTANGMGRVGWTNPLLYQLNPILYDIKDGSTNGYYPAVNGYDMATGLGTLYGKGAQVLSTLTFATFSPTKSPSKSPSKSPIKQPTRSPSNFTATTPSNVSRNIQFENSSNSNISMNSIIFFILLLIFIIF
jgi:kumamolisin